MKNLCYSIVIVCGLWAGSAYSAQTVRDWIDLIVGQCSEVAVDLESKYSLNNSQSQGIFFKCLSLEFEELSGEILEAGKAKKKGEFQL